MTTIPLQSTHLLPSSLNPFPKHLYSPPTSALTGVTALKRGIPDQILKPHTISLQMRLPSQENIIQTPQSDPRLLPPPIPTSNHSTLPFVTALTGATALYRKIPSQIPKPNSLPTLKRRPSQKRTIQPPQSLPVPPPYPIPTPNHPTSPSTRAFTGATAQNR